MHAYCLGNWGDWAILEPSCSEQRRSQVLPGPLQRCNKPTQALLFAYLLTWRHSRNSSESLVGYQLLHVLYFPYVNLYVLGCKCLFYLFEDLAYTTYNLNGILLSLLLFPFRRKARSSDMNLTKSCRSTATCYRRPSLRPRVAGHNLRLYSIATSNFIATSNDPIASANWDSFSR